MKKNNSGFKYTSGLIQSRKFTNNVNLSAKFTRRVLTLAFITRYVQTLVMHQFIHTLSFLSENDSLEGPAMIVMTLAKIRHRLFLEQWSTLVPVLYRYAAPGCIILMRHTSNTPILLIVRRHLAHEKSNGRK